MKVLCMQCNTPIEIGEIPRPQIFNAPAATVLLVEHPKRAFCLECKTDVAVNVLGIQQIQMRLGAVPIPKEEAPSPIIPATSIPKIIRSKG